MFSFRFLQKVLYVSGKSRVLFLAKAEAVVRSELGQFTTGQFTTDIYFSEMKGPVVTCPEVKCPVVSCP